MASSCLRSPPTVASAPSPAIHDKEATAPPADIVHSSHPRRHSMAEPYDHGNSLPHSPGLENSRPYSDLDPEPSVAANQNSSSARAEYNSTPPRLQKSQQMYQPQQQLQQQQQPLQQQQLDRSYGHGNPPPMGNPTFNHSGQSVGTYSQGHGGQNRGTDSRRTSQMISGPGSYEGGNPNSRSNYSDGTGSRGVSPSRSQMHQGSEAYAGAHNEPSYSRKASSPAPGLSDSTGPNEYAFASPPEPGHLQHQQYRKPSPARMSSPANTGPGPGGPGQFRSVSQPSGVAQGGGNPNEPSPSPQGRRLSTIGQPGNRNQQPNTIAGEPLHDLQRAVGLLKSSKFYAEGFLMKKVEVGSDGKTHPNNADSQWAKWFVQLSGTIMSTWNASEMEEAARQNRTVPPQYLNLSDAFLHPFPPSHNEKEASPTPFRFALNSAGLNRLVFCAPSMQSLSMWINAIRLAGWERSRCNEIYTGSLLGLREPKPQGWEGLEEKTGRLEGWLKTRLPGDTEWRRVWVTIVKGNPGNSSAANATTSKKSKRTSFLGLGKKTIDVSVIDDVPGDGAVSTMAFYATRPTKREQPLCIVQHVFYASAIFPETEKLIDKSSLFKIEGTFLNPVDGFKMGWGVGGRAEKQGFALCMLDEGDSFAMLRWIVGLAEAFKLYGQPPTFSYDPRNPNSLYFALPVGPHRDRQFLDRELVDNLDVGESRPRAIRAVFHNILFDRMRGVRPAALDRPAGRDGEAAVAAQKRQSIVSPNDQGALRRSEGPARNFNDSSHQLASIGETGAHEADKNDTPTSVGPTEEGQRSQMSQSDYGVSETQMSREIHPATDSLFDRTPQLAQRQLIATTSGDNSSPDGFPDYATYGNQPAPTAPVPERTVAGFASDQHLGGRAFGQAVNAISSDEPKSAQNLPGSMPMQTPPVLAPGPPPAVGVDSLSSHASPSFTASTMANDTNRAVDGVPHFQSHGLSVVTASSIENNNTNDLLAPTPKSPALPYLLTHADDSTGESAYRNYAIGAQQNTGHAEEPLGQTNSEVSVIEGSIPQSTSSRDLAGAHGAHGAHGAQMPVDATMSPPTQSSGLSTHSSETVTRLPPAASATARRMSQVEREGAAKKRNSVYDDPSIHSDLLAALSFVDKSESPPPHEPATPSQASSIANSPVVPRSGSFQVGPPSRALRRPSSPPDHEYSDNPKLSSKEAVKGSAAAIPSVNAQNSAPTAFPSTFAKNKGAERQAAAQAAQQAQRDAFTKPGRAAGLKGKQKAWQDSDEDEEEAEEEEEESDDEGAQVMEKPSLVPSGDSSVNGSFNDEGRVGSAPARDTAPFSRGQNAPSLYNASDARGSYYDIGAGDRTSYSPPYQQDLRDISPKRQSGKPAVNPHGLLHAGILDREERSARALESQAREGGGPLVSLPSKPPPPQTGLVGAITSHQRDKERSGGVGRALTEQQRERKLAEQRQKQLDDLQRQQLQQQQMQVAHMQQMQQYGGYNPMMMNPYMAMGGMGHSMMMPPMSVAGSVVGIPAHGGASSPTPGQMSGQHSGGNGDAIAQQQAMHVHMMQVQAAQQAAQQAYMAAMAQFQPPVAPSSPNGSPAVQGMPSHNSMSFPSYMPPTGYVPASPPQLPVSPSFPGYTQPMSPFGFNPYAANPSMYGQPGPSVSSFNPYPATSNAEDKGQSSLLDNNESSNHLSAATPLTLPPRQQLE